MAVSKPMAVAIFIGGIIGVQLLELFSIPPFTDNHIRGLIMALLGGWLGTQFKPLNITVRKGKWHEKLKAVTLFMVFTLLIFYIYLDVSLHQYLLYISCPLIMYSMYPYFPVGKRWRDSVDLACLMLIGAVIMYVVDQVMRPLLDYVF